MYRCARKEKTGGGVTILEKDSLVLRERGDMKEGMNVEGSLWIEIRNGRIVWCS